MKSSTFVKSTLILTLATLISKILGSIFRIPLQNIAGDEVLGIFSLVYPVYMVALILSVAGIPVAISQLIAKERTNHDEAAIRNIYTTASILAFSFGLLSFLLIYTFSDFIAAALGGQNTRPALIIVSMTLLVAPYMAVYRGYFQGFEHMQPTAVSQVIEQFVRVILILVAAYVLVAQNLANDIIVGGVMIGSVVGAIASLLYLRIKFTRSDFKPVSSEHGYSLSVFKHWSAIILKTSIPIAFGAITMALLNFVDSITIPLGLKLIGATSSDISYLYGIYGRGLALVQIATVFATSIILPLIPLVTKYLEQNKVNEAAAVVKKSHVMTHLISWPAGMGLFALILPLNLALFTDNSGTIPLVLLMLSSVLTSLTVLGTGILQGIRLARQAAFVIMAGVGIKVILNITLVASFELEGAALSTLIVYFILFLVNSWFIYRHIPFKIIDSAIAKIIGSSFMMAFVIGLPTLFLNVNTWSRWEAMLYTVLGILVGALIYGGCLLITRALSRDLLASIPVVGSFIQRKLMRKD